MPSTTLKRHRIEEALHTKSPKKVKRVNRQLEYHSSSEDEDIQQGARSKSQDPDEIEDAQSADDINISEVEDHSSARRLSAAESEAKSQLTSEDESTAGSEGSAEDKLKKRKRNDPDAFATSISKILGSKLSTSKRTDPVLSRSKDANNASKELSEVKLEARAGHKLREERRAALERGRIKDVLGTENTNTSTADVIEQEKKLKKTAQRGVIKLFNAVRAAQVKGEEAAKELRQSGMIGMEKRGNKVTEMSKKGFLDLIAGGGKKVTPVVGT